MGTSVSATGVRVVESVPGGRTNDFEVSGHAEPEDSLDADDDAVPVIVPGRLLVGFSDPGGVVRVAESVPGGSENEYDFKAHAGLELLLKVDEEAESVIAFVPVGVVRVVESVPGGNEKV